MTWPGTAAKAEQVAVGLLKRSLAGGENSVQSECERVSQIARTIWERWRVGPWQWRCKHVRWYLEHCGDKYSDWTRYRHWLTVTRIIAVTGKLEQWRPVLCGPWTRPVVQSRQRNELNRHSRQ